MAASSEYDIDFEELERLFIDDTTDEQFSFDEIEAISEPSLSGKDSFLSTNVSFSSLKLVLVGWQINRLICGTRAGNCLGP